MDILTTWADRRDLVRHLWVVICAHKVVEIAKFHEAVNRRSLQRVTSFSRGSLLSSSIQLPTPKAVMR
jgi:hypothetical protein